MATILKEILKIICLAIFGEEVYNEGLNEEILPSNQNKEEKPKFTEEDLKKQKKILLGALILFYIGLLLFFFDDGDDIFSNSDSDFESIFGSDSESKDE